MARPHTLRKSAATVPLETHNELSLLDHFSSLPPIPYDKPWIDEVERAAVYHCLKSAPPLMALCAAGVPIRTASTWLSDEPPEAYKSACVALSAKLKEAEQACAAGLFANIHKAAQDPRYWTAAAWTLERKHGYVVQQQALTGPATVINIGQLTVNQGAPGRVTWRDEGGESDVPAQISTAVDATLITK